MKLLRRLTTKIIRANNRLLVGFISLKMKIKQENIILTSDIELKTLLKMQHVKLMYGSVVSGNSDIGEYTYIGRYSEVCECKVGRYCSIGNWVSIGIGDHDINKVSTNSIFMEDPLKTLNSSSVSIGDDVWIGTKATVLRGVTIGRGAVIGAGAVVTRDIPPYAIAVGVPAKVLKFRFDSEKIKKIEESKWYNEDSTGAKKIINMLASELESND